MALFLIASVASLSDIFGGLHVRVVPNRVLNRLCEACDSFGEQALEDDALGRRRLAS